MPPSPQALRGVFAHVRPMVEGMAAAAALTDQERSAVTRYLGDIAVVLRVTLEEPDRPDAA